MISEENAEWQGHFDSFVKELNEHITTLELTDFGGLRLTYQTSGLSDDAAVTVRALMKDKEKSGTLVFDNFTFMFLQKISDPQRDIYLYISINSDSNGKKRALIVTDFYDVAFLATCDHHALNSTTSKILGLFDQYCEE